MTASTDEAREELRNRLPDVLRIVAGMVGNHNWSPGRPDTVAEAAPGYVIACERVCGYGEDSDA